MQHIKYAQSAYPNQHDCGHTLCRRNTDTLQIRMLIAAAVLQDQYQPNGQFSKTKVAFCVHNIAYQVGYSLQ